MKQYFLNLDQLTLCTVEQLNPSGTLFPLCIFSASAGDLTRWNIASLDSQIDGFQCFLLGSLVLPLVGINVGRRYSLKAFLESAINETSSKCNYKNYDVNCSFCVLLNFS